MAPEQALGRSEEIDGLTDVWAVGATLFALLTGDPVHAASTAQEQMVLAATRSPRPLGSVQPEVPPAVAQIVDRALAFHRAARWPSAAAMRDAVREVYRAEYGEDPSAAALVFMASPEKMPVSDRSPHLRSPMASTVPETPVSVEPRRLGDAMPSPTSLMPTSRHPHTLAAGRVRVAAGAVVLIVVGVVLGAWGATRGRAAPASTSTTMTGVTTAPADPPPPAATTAEPATAAVTATVAAGPATTATVTTSITDGALAPRAAPPAEDGSLRGARLLHGLRRHRSSRGPVRSSMKGWPVALAVGLTWALACPARAGDGTDKAAATELFDAGRDMMKQGDYAGACPKLAESARLEPTVGALAKLAECEEHEHRLVSAYGRWKQALNLARSAGDERAGDVEKEVARIDAIVPKLQITATGALSPDTVIRVDSVELGPAGLGVALAVEPGPHALQASAPHKTTWSTTVETKADGATTPVTIPVLEDVRPVLAPPPPPPPLFTPQPAPPPPSGHASAWPTVGLVTAGAGVVAVGVGAALGFVAMGQRNDAGCPGNVCPDDAHASTLRGAKGTADVSTALFIVGGALLGGGLATWWLSSGPAHGQTGVLFTPAGAIGRF